MKLSIGPKLTEADEDSKPIKIRLSLKKRIV